VSLSTVFDVRVTPRAGRTTIAGFKSPEIAATRVSPDFALRASSRPALLVKLAAAPVDGAANEALIALLAQALDLPKRAIRIVSGERSRNKRVEVVGLTFDEVVRRLEVAAGL
jgi:uncharacterized protein YggU (UPF0235/DUF167 family)